MPKGCHITRNDEYYYDNREYCRRFCEESSAYCDGPEQPPGCTVCISAGYAILHRTITVGPCEENPEPDYILENNWVYTDIVVVAGDLTITKDTCLACVAIQAHPCYDEYVDYIYQVWNTGIYVGKPVTCICPH